jgi:hypothetical protein
MRLFRAENGWKPTPSQAAEKRVEATSEALWDADPTRAHCKNMWSRFTWNLFFRSQSGVGIKVQMECGFRGC